MTGSEEPIAVEAYDELADSYAEEVRENPYRAHLEFPATTSLIPDVEGKRLLDAGCGTGVYTKWLLERGAEVVGVDASEAMLDCARQRVGDRATFHQADLGKPLDFLAADAFDGVVSPLTLGYVEDWREPFAEFARVLAPGGVLVFSTVHPLDQFPPDDPEMGEDPGDANYYEVEQQIKEWDVDVPYYAG